MKFATRPAAKLYGIVMAARNRHFDAGMRVTQVGRPVVSVGNLTVGGTGKTPMVQWIVTQLRGAGHVPAVAMRGYLAEKGAESDEAMEHRSALRGTVVLVGPDRVTTIRRHLEGGAFTDVFVLDDGFQHRFVARNLDIVLIDARHDLSREHLLPAGHLREPGKSLRRADAVVVTHARDSVWDASAWIERMHGRQPLASCQHVWASIARHSADRAEDVAVSTIEGMKLVTRLGIARSDAMRASIVSAGGTIIEDLPAKDHAAIAPREQQHLTEAARHADAILMTHKDWVKYEPLVDWERLGVPVLVPRLELSFLDGESALQSRVLEAARTETP